MDINKKSRGGMNMDKEKSFLYKLYDGNYIEETKNAIRVVFKYRYIESIL